MKIDRAKRNAGPEQLVTTVSMTPFMAAKLAESILANLNIRKGGV